MIVVVGSVNLDLVASVERLPKPGETITATEFATVHGGKGANQAVAAARLGGQVVFIGAAGDDPDSELLLDGLADEGIDVSNTMTIPDTRCGTALITVDAVGENVIAVHPGANSRLVLSPQALSAIESADVVLMQLEIPVSVVVAAARAASGIVVLNAAPASVLPVELVERTNVLIVNEHERAVTLGDGRLAAQTVVITTMGAEGADVEEMSNTTHVLAPQAHVVDTTGAGDTFCGAFAAAIDRGEPTIDAALWATHAASLSTTAIGARTAMPTRHEVEASVGDVQ